jgi:hypothetical protein
LASRRHAIPLALLGLLALAAAIGFASFPTYPNYDSQYSLVWGRELLDGIAPTFDAYRAPTEHPLLVAVSVPLAALGDPGPRVFVALCFIALLALIAAVYRLGDLVAGPLCGLAAAAIVASRLNFWLLASIGFLDLPYCALVMWALALEVARPRRGAPVLVLLALAGLLRPEAWVLSVLYAAWLGRPLAWRARARLAALAISAPVLWCALDLAVTGDVLFSIHHTDALAQELVRERPLHDLPWLMVKLLAEILKWPLLVLALGGALLAWRARVRALTMPAVLVVVTCATYLVIASGGLATVYRYLLTAALALAVFAGYALTGWTQAGEWRQRWTAAAALAVALGGVYTLTHTSPDKVRDELRQRERIRDDLVAILDQPAVARARRCGPVTTPTHKLMPDIRWHLDVPESAVRARSQRRPQPTRGVALVINRRIQNRSAVNVREVKADNALVVQTPPAGFQVAASNGSFSAWVRC